MLHHFIQAHRDEILRRGCSRIATRSALTAANAEPGLLTAPFLDAFVETLGDRLRTGPDGDQVGIRCGPDPRTAGSSIEQVVHAYGDLRQVVRELALEMGEAVTCAEFNALDTCLDQAIGRALAEHVETILRARHAVDSERYGVFAHELSNYLSAAFLAYEILKARGEPLDGSAGSTLRRSLLELRELVGRSLEQILTDPEKRASGAGVAPVE